METGMWGASLQGELATEEGIDSFSVCSLVREELSEIRRFVDHYMRSGAEHIYLYFDGSKVEAKEHLAAYADVDAVTISVCDAEFWKKTFPEGNNPKLVPKQIAIRKIAVGLNKSDWLLFCDADEYVTGDESLGVVLSRLPQHCPGVVIRNSEAVWGAGDDIGQAFGCGYERHGFPAGFIGQKVLPIVVYGRNAFPMQRGVSGHCDGKHLLRRGVMPDEIKCHSSIIGGNRVDHLGNLLPVENANVRIVHFDAIGYERWRMKWENRISGVSVPSTRNAPRIKQWSMIADAFEAGNGEKLFKRFNSLNRWQQFVLERLGLLGRIENSFEHTRF